MELKRQDPNEVLDWTQDWADLLDDGETISTSEWSVDRDLVIDSDSNTTTAATVTLSGGTVNRVYTVDNKVTTSAGRTLSRAFLLRVLNL